MNDINQANRKRNLDQTFENVQNITSCLDLEKNKA